MRDVVEDIAYRMDALSSNSSSENNKIAAVVPMDYDNGNH